jgi:hypothetical protein
VDDGEGVPRPQRRHRGLQLGQAHGRELRHAGVGQERLAAERARVDQGRQLGEVAGDDPAPEADVDVAAPRGGAPLGLQRRHAGGARQAVERHVHDGGDPAGRRRRGGVLEALPVGAAGLVDVHVGVDQPGHYQGVARLHQPAAGRRVPEVGDPLDDAADDVDRRRPDALGGDHPAAADDQLGHGVAARRQPTPSSRSTGSMAK